MWFEVNVRLSEVTDLKWPHGTEWQCALCKLNSSNWPNHAQMLSFASMASRQGAVKHGFVSKIAGGCSSYDVIAPWPYLTRRVLLDSFFRTDSTLTHMTIQVTQLRLNSNPKFANLTQLWLNSKPKFINLTQLWLNSFESELSQIWLTTHHILPNLGKSCWPGGGGGAVECSCRLVLSL